MLFGKIFKKEVKRPPRPPWVKWLVIAVFAFAVFQGVMRGPEGTPRNDVQKAIDEAEKTLKTQTTVNLTAYKRILFPNRQATLNIQDKEIGKGALAFCGQDVAIAYQSFHMDNTPIKDTARPDNPLRYRLGAGEALPAFNHGVIGMRVGGKRSLLVPHNMGYGVKGFTRTDISSDEQIRFEIELLSATPQIPNIDDIPFRIATLHTGSGNALSCGQKGHFNIIIWNTKGKKLFSSDAQKNATQKDTTTQKGYKSAISFTPGKSEICLGIEQGVVGMKPGGVRTLIIPPAFQKPLHNNAASLQFPLPKDETILVDIEYLP